MSTNASCTTRPDAHGVTTRPDEDGAETTVPAPDPVAALAAEEGWQALALAALGRSLGEAELAAVHHLPVAIALDLLFPDLDAAARHEAMWALG